MSSEVFLSFSKLQGTGNDFVIVDNRGKDFERFCGDVSPEDAVRAICSRRTGVGADGLILLEPSERADFSWRFFNADGSTAKMCGNGARCIARFAVEKGIAGERLSFETPAGIVDAFVRGRTVKVRLPPPGDQEETEAEGVKGYLINSGVPHFVVFVEDLEGADVEGLGRRIRFLLDANVDFAVVKDEKVFVRTYERGVEGETLACGTGAVATAVVARRLFSLPSPVEVVTRSGESLKIHFDSALREIFLEGSTLYLYDGTLRREVFHGGSQEKPFVP